MKVLLILLCAFRAVHIMNAGFKLHRESKKLWDVLALFFMSALWVASLVWLIKL